MKIGDECMKIVDEAQKKTGCGCVETLRATF
jgi:hypothetical protein